MDKEIDYSMTNKRSIVKDSQTVNVGRDHNIVRGTAKTNTRLEGSGMVRSGKSTVNIEALLLEKGEFRLKLQNRFEVLGEEGAEDMKEMASKITNTIQESLQYNKEATERRTMRSLK